MLPECIQDLIAVNRNKREGTYADEIDAMHGN